MCVHISFFKYKYDRVYKIVENKTTKITKQKIMNNNYHLQSANYQLF